VFARIVNRLYGYDRLRRRGDQLFLSGEFERARLEYEKARTVLGSADHRRLAIDALIRDCGRHHRGGVAAVPVQPERASREPGGGGDAFHAGLEDIFELAIADKGEERVHAYRALDSGFKAGYVALVQGDAPRAIRLLSEVAARPGASFVVHLELARAHSLEDQMALSREALALAEKLAPNDWETRVLAAAVDIELGRFEAAHQRLLALRRPEAEPEPEISFLLGRALSGLNRNDAALEMFRATVHREPHFHEAFFEGGKLLGAVGDREAQFELLSRACALAPDEVPYNRELVAVVIASELDPEAGLAACDRLLATDEDNAWEYLSWVAELYLRRGWKREARDPLTKALELVPNDRRAERDAIERRLAEL